MSTQQLTWIQHAAQMGLTLTAEQIAQFERYESMLLDWNANRLNLTAITDPAEVRIRHFLDSLTCARWIQNPSALRLIDIGTGGGLPGLPLKILYPSLHVTLADSVTKKTHFLTAVVKELGLNNVSVVAARAEELGQDINHREQYDWVVARSVAHMRVLAEYLIPLCKINGSILAQKGENAPKEIAESAFAIGHLGGGDPALYPVELPGREVPHYAVLIKKTAATPAKYPRRAGKPSKRPLIK